MQELLGPIGGGRWLYLKVVVPIIALVGICLLAQPLGQLMRDFPFLSMAGPLIIPLCVFYFWAVDYKRLYDIFGNVGVAVILTLLQQAIVSGITAIIVTVSGGSAMLFWYAISNPGTSNLIGLASGVGLSVLIAPTAAFLFMLFCPRIYD
jgi:hypothetical protein